MLAFPIVIALFSVALVFVYRGVNHNSLNNTEQKRIVNSLSDNPKIYSDKCHLSLLDTEIPPCIYGDILGAKTVVLFGDSHAAHWFPALDSLAKKYGWRLISLTKSACPSFDVSVVNSALGRKYMECDIWRESAFLRIKNADPYLVVLANSSKYLLDTTKADFEFGMTRTLKKIANKKYNVIISDTPWPNDNPLTCLSKAIWLEREISQCNFVEKSLHRKDMKLLDMRVSSKYEQTFNIDLYDEFCSSSVCFVEKAGDVVYRDSHHMTAKFSTNLNSSLYLKLKSYMDNL